MGSGVGPAHLVCVDAVVHERPADAACIEREADSPVDGADDGGPPEERAPVEREACRLSMDADLATRRAAHRGQTAASV